MKNDVWEVVPRPTGKSVMTIAPIDRYTTFRTIISLVALFEWKLHHIDVKTVFLNGKIEEEAHIEQHEGFVTHGKKTYVCKLKKVLYGLKHAPRVWYVRLDGLLHDLGSSKSTTKSNLYFEVEVANLYEGKIRYF